MTSHGRNVWYELMTTDTEAAKAFYTETIGWKSQHWGNGDPSNPYTLFMVDDCGIGGLMALPEDAKRAGAQPHWLAYTAVKDVDAAAKKAESLGGQVHKQPFDVPDVGRIAILADPQGATFALYRASGDEPPAEQSTAGFFSWAELNTTDWESAWEFYSQLFDWNETHSMEMDGLGTYFMFDDRSKFTKGGMCNVARSKSVPPHWLHYVTVDDINETVERIKAKGGKILNGPMPIPGDDLIAQCMDPQGAAFALFQEGKK